MSAAGRPRIGVLALQGSVREHVAALRQLDVDVREVRRARHLEGLNGLILPGGESTTFRRLMTGELLPAVRQAYADGVALFGTCAGLILLAREIVEQAEPGVRVEQARAPGPGLAVLDVAVERNAYGRQAASFEAALALRPPLAPGEPFPGVFIRAPRIVSTGPGVAVMAALGDEPVLVQQGRVLGASFHPELTSDLRIHRYFVEEVAGWRRFNS